MTTTGRRPDLNLDLFDTKSCKPRLSCECCRGRNALAVSACHTPLGVLCLTLCGECTETGKRPVWFSSRGADRVGDHCLHLGIDRATMRSALAKQNLGLPELWFTS